MKKLIFIANPKAGRMCFLSGTPVMDFVRGIEREFSDWDVRVLTTNDPGELRAKLARHNPDSIHAVFTLGGDGTLNRSLDSLLNLNRKGVPIGILPAGTANDFACSLGMELSLDCVARAIDGAPVQAVDVIRVNGAPLITVGGTGIGSRLLEDVEQARQGRGRLGLGLVHKLSKTEMYSLLGLKGILRGNIDPQDKNSVTHHLRATVSNEQSQQFTEFTTSALFICNQGQLGGNLHVSPTSCTTDGVFELLAVQATSRLGLIHALLDFKRGRTPMPSFMLRTSSLVLEDMNGRQIPFFGDGEIIQCASRLQFEVEPGALRVFRLTPLLHAQHQQREPICDDEFVATSA